MKMRKALFFIPFFLLVLTASVFAVGVVVPVKAITSSSVTVLYGSYYSDTKTYYPVGNYTTGWEVDIDLSHLTWNETAENNFLYSYLRSSAVSGYPSIAIVIWENNDINVKYKASSGGAETVINTDQQVPTDPLPLVRCVYASGKLSIYNGTTTTKPLITDFAISLPLNEYGAGGNHGCSAGYATITAKMNVAGTIDIAGILMLMIPVVIICVVLSKFGNMFTRMFKTRR